MRSRIPGRTVATPGDVFAATAQPVDRRTAATRTNTDHAEARVNPTVTFPGTGCTAHNVALVMPTVVVDEPTAHNVDLVVPTVVVVPATVQDVALVPKIWLDTRHDDARVTPTVVNAELLLYPFA